MNYAVRHIRACVLALREPVNVPSNVVQCRLRHQSAGWTGKMLGAGPCVRGGAWVGNGRPGGIGGVGGQVRAGECRSLGTVATCSLVKRKV